MPISWREPPINTSAWAADRPSADASQGTVNTPTSPRRLMTPITAKVLEALAFIAGATLRQAETPHMPLPVPMRAPASLSRFALFPRNMASQMVMAMTTSMMAMPTIEASASTSAVTRAPISTMASRSRYRPA